MPEELEREEGKAENKKESRKRKTGMDSNLPKYIGIILFAFVVSLFSFYMTRKLVLPYVYKSKIEKQIEEESSIDLSGMELGGVADTFGNTQSLEDTSSNTKEKKGGFFARIFGKKEKEAKKSKGLGNIIKITDITVNTNKSDGLRFVLVELAIEVHDKKVSQEIKDREPQVRDMFISYFRSKTAPEIARLDFQEKSKKELMEKLNDLLQEGKVDSIYYTKLILQ